MVAWDGRAIFHAATVALNDDGLVPAPAPPGCDGVRLPASPHTAQRCGSAPPGGLASDGFLEPSLSSGCYGAFVC
eukprot:COSAG04_NODE_185_length_21024_cov_49.557276_8_plen_75_part_00